MRRIKYSRKARSDLQEIYDYLDESFGSQIADKKFDQIINDIDLLGEDPYIGKKIEGNMRKWRSGPSIIIYDIEEITIEILHVVDGRSDYFNRLFG